MIQRDAYSTAFDRLTVFSVAADIDGLFATDAYDAADYCFTHAIMIWRQRYRC